MTAGYYPFVEVGLVVDEKLAFVDMIDKPLLYASEDKAIEAIFARQTDMSHIDKCFRGQPSLEEDIRDNSAGSD
jgi:hypothetical protein